MTSMAAASRVVASSACQAGPSGRGGSGVAIVVARPRGHRHECSSSSSSSVSIDSARCGRRGRGDRRATSRTLTVCSSSVPSSTRGSQQPAMSTLVPEAETAKGGAAAPVVEEEHDDVNAAGEQEDAAVVTARRTLPSGLEIVVAQDMPEFEIAAELRATAFYEDLEARQALPFPPRFVATFRREFAQRERRALKDRTAQPSGLSRRCLCLMSRLPDLGLVGCLDISVRNGPCASQVNGVCVSEGEEYVYIDNVAVDAAARRRGSASAMLEASSDVAITWGAGFMYTHVHADNVAARRLYHAYGFRAPKGMPIAEAMSPGKGAQWASPRLAGLVLLRAPLPLMHHAASEKAAAAIGDCTCGATFEDCDECICNPETK